MSFRQNLVIDTWQKRKKVVYTSYKPSEPELLKLKYQFAGPLTSEDKENLEYAQELAKPLHKLWIDRFPLLNGKDGRPLLNTDLIELIVLSHPSDLSGSKLIKVLISELQRYSDGQF